ncbi:conserved hypothetical protein [Crenothrix polyspora]|uniref:DUF3301 domain-containing protein n=1 Tax=Crenothrix polyspora TaxID=360316 RepID=A0A1R4HAK2_9GAMM|nr:DUF3301 domain-containing protein [Crenothrix polyspora]SJM93196.1 conserved hypothetical protein [Crenothrix polyspora]
MIDDIIFIGLLLCAFIYWMSAQKVKEIAFMATRDYCLAMEVQMLDAYIALTSIGFERDNAGKMQLKRTFMFEFSSTGYERYSGKIIMLGRKVKSIVMDPYRLR